MNDSKKNLTEEELKLIKEEELFMEEVYSDPEVANAEPPADLHDKVFAEIHAREAAKKEAELAEEKRLAEEREEERKAKDLEFMKLERRYKRAVKMEKWVVLAAILVMAFAFSVTAMGGPEKIFERIKYALTGHEQVTIDSQNEDVVPITTMSEEKVYQEIEDTFGFAPVGLGYLPEDVIFLDAQIGEEIQFINIVYGEGEKTKIVYLIQPNFQVGSLGKDVEDEFIEEYIKENEYTTIYIRKYLADETEERWSIQFEYQKVSYSMTIMDVSRDKVEMIAENLIFP